MPSSNRILRGGRTKGALTAADGAPAPDAGSAPASAASRSTILRGRPHRASVGSPSGAGGTGEGERRGAGGTGGIGGLAGALGIGGAGAPGLAPEVVDELRNVRKIAEERGYAAGHARASAELEAAVVAAGALAQRLEGDAPRATTSVAHAIAELALAIARRVVGAEVQMNPAILVRSLEIAVGSVNGSPEARVLLHPDAVGPVRVAWEAVHGLAFLGKRWTFEADPSLPPGGCILRFEHGFVDAGLEAQLEEIGIALDGAIPGFWRDVSEDEAGAA